MNFPASYCVSKLPKFFFLTKPILLIYLTNLASLRLNKLPKILESMLIFIISSKKIRTKDQKIFFYGTFSKASQLNVHLAAIHRTLSPKLRHHSEYTSLIVNLMNNRII